MYYSRPYRDSWLAALAVAVQRFPSSLISRFLLLTTLFKYLTRSKLPRLDLQPFAGSVLSGPPLTKAGSRNSWDFLVFSSSLR